MTTPLEFLPDIWRLPIPLHVRSEPVNVWILRDGDGALTLFDTGIDAGAAELWPAALDAIGHVPADVRRIIVSHHHPDHLGGTRALHELTGATLHASPATIAKAPVVWGDAGRMETYFAELQHLLDDHGFPANVAAALGDEAAAAKLAVQLAPPDAWSELAPGTSIEAGGRTWEVVPTPGHADGQIALFAPASGLLLAADHLLERVSPAVGLFPHHDADPLGSYLESLERVAQLDVSTVLPGHGAPFSGARERLRFLVGHHVERIDQCVGAVRAAGGATAYEVARSVFSRVFERDALDAPNQRFATTESLAHLERARAVGLLEQRHDDDGITRYIAIDA